MKENLLNKFKHIGFLDYKIVDKELSKFTTIEEKLEYLKDVKANYFDKFLTIFKNLNNDELNLYPSCKDEIWNKIFGEKNESNLWTELKIQEPVYSKHFKNEMSNPAFTYWFLKYDADVWFRDHINSEDFRNKLKSNLKKIRLQADLDKINKIQNDAKELLRNEENDFSKNYRIGKGILWTFNPNIKLIETLRVLDGNFYINNVTQSLGTTSLEVQAYAKHILLKPFLENELKKIENPINELHSFNEVNEVIEENIEAKDILKEIWLSDSKLSVSNFLNIGVECGIWNTNYEIMLRRGSPYGSGKAFLGSLAVALKKYSISNNTDYKVIGKAFCQAFKIDVLKESSDPYKSFQMGNGKYIRELKRAFNIK